MQAPTGSYHVNPKALTAFSSLNTRFPYAHIPNLIEICDTQILIPLLQKDTKGRQASTLYLLAPTASVILSQGQITEDHNGKGREMPSSHIAFVVASPSPLQDTFPHKYY